MEIEKRLLVQVEVSFDKRVENFDRKVRNFGLSPNEMTESIFFLFHFSNCSIGWTRRHQS